MNMIVSLGLVIAGNIIWSRAVRDRSETSRTVRAWLGFGVTLHGLAGLAVALAEQLDLYAGLGIGEGHPLWKVTLHALLVLLIGGVSFYLTRALTSRHRADG